MGVRVAVACTLALWACSGPRREADERSDMAATDDAPRLEQSDVAEWVEMIDQLPPGDFAPLASFDDLEDGTRVKMDSMNWFEQMLRSTVNPYWIPPAFVRRSVHTARGDLPDVLRHEIELDDVAISLFETVEFALIRVDRMERDVLALPSEERPGAFLRRVNEIVALQGIETRRDGEKAPYAIALPVPDAVAEGLHFSTAPGRAPHTLHSWTERVDAGVRGGRIYVLAFKARGGGGRVMFLDPRHWFDGACWAPYERR